MAKRFWCGKAMTRSLRRSSPSGSGCWPDCRRARCLPLPASAKHAPKRPLPVRPPPPRRLPDGQGQRRRDPGRRHRHPLRPAPRGRQCRPDSAADGRTDRFRRHLRGRAAAVSPARRPAFADAAGPCVFGPPGGSPQRDRASGPVRAPGTARGHRLARCRTGDLTDPFLKKTLMLAVDGTAPEDLRHMMELELANLAENEENLPRVFESAGGFAPTIGILGAVLGLIQVMQHLDNIQEVGRGIAVAFVATIYGVGSANLFFLPAAGKLRLRLRELQVQREMILEGIVSILEGMNPRMLETKL